MLHRNPPRVVGSTDWQLVDPCLKPSLHPKVTPWMAAALSPSQQKSKGVTLNSQPQTIRSSSYKAPESSARPLSCRPQSGCLSGWVCRGAGRGGKRQKQTHRDREQADGCRKEVWGAG